MADIARRRLNDIMDLRVSFGHFSTGPGGLASWIEWDVGIASTKSTALSHRKKFYWQSDDMWDQMCLHVVENIWLSVWYGNEASYVQNILRSRGSKRLGWHRKCCSIVHLKCGSTAIPRGSWMATCKRRYSLLSTTTWVVCVYHVQFIWRLWRVIHARSQLDLEAFRMHCRFMCSTITREWCLRLMVAMNKSTSHSRSKRAVLLLTILCRFTIV